MVKRAFDVLCSAVGLVLLALPMAIIGLLVRMDSPGPALFRQERVGRDGVTFLILKFRTMHTASPGGLKLTASGDPRVTRLGAWLRQTKIDELPQLINVIRGDMSLVGPRPEVPEYAFLLPEQHEVWRVRPGITDPTAVALRDESALLERSENPDEYYRTVLLPHKTALYLEYARDRTLLTDIRAIMHTISILLLGIDFANGARDVQAGRLLSQRQERYLLSIVGAYALAAQRLIVPRGPGEAVPIANVVVFLAVAVLVVRVPGIVRLVKERLERAPWLTAFLGTGLVLPVLGIVVGYPLRTLYGVQLSLGLIAFVVIGIVFAENRSASLLRLAPTLAIVAWVQFLFGVLQAVYYSGLITGFATRWVFLWDQAVTKAWGVELFGGRSFGLYLNPNVYSLLGAFLLVIAVSGGFPRRSVLTISAPALGIIALGGSRTVIIAMLIVGIPGVVRWLSRMSTVRRRKLLVIGLIAAAMTVLALFSSDVLHDRFLSRWSTLPDMLTQGLSADRNMAARFGAWSQAFAVWRTVPFGTFGPPQMATAIFLDNEYIQLLVQGGMVFLTLFVGTLVSAYRRASSSRLKRVVGRMVALVGVSSLTLISGAFPPTMCLFWPLIGASTVTPGSNAEDLSRRPWSVWLVLAVFVASYTVIAVVMRLTGLDYNAFRM